MLVFGGGGVKFCFSKFIISQVPVLVTFVLIYRDCSLLILFSVLKRWLQNNLGSVMHLASTRRLWRKANVTKSLHCIAVREHYIYSILFYSR